MQDSDYPEAADYIRGYVKANQVNNYLELIKKTKRTVYHSYHCQHQLLQV